MLPSEPYDITRISEILQASEKAHVGTLRRMHSLVRELDPLISRYVKLSPLKSQTARPTELKEVEYVAVDGTRDIIEGHTHARIFAGGFAIHGFTGSTGVSEIDKKCAYSVVSLPYKVLTPTNEYLVESTTEITNLVMLLSELFIATEFAERTRPTIILLDRPLCGTMAHTSRTVERGSALYDLGATEISEESPVPTLGPGLAIFKDVCNQLFIDTNPEPLRVSGHYLSSVDLMYLCRVGLEHLVDVCHKKGVMLVGLIKNTSDNSFLRLLLSLRALEGKDTSAIVRVQEIGDDIRVLESWLEPYGSKLTTCEYDTALMTQFLDQHGKLKSSQGYAPPGRFLRSYMNFGRLEEGGFVFAVERMTGAEESPPRLQMSRNLEILLYDVERDPVQDGLVDLLRQMCGGPMIDSLYYPLPLALAHRYAKSTFDYVRPRLRHARQLVGADWGYGDIKRAFS